MSRTTNEINRITGTIISVAIKLIVCAAVIFLLLEGASRGYDFGYRIFNQEAVAEAPGTDIEIRINEWESTGDVAKMLIEEGLISDAYVFYAQSLFYEYDIWPGTYTLNDSLTSKEILQVLNEKVEEEGD